MDTVRPILKGRTANTGFASGGLIPFRSSRDKLCKLEAWCFY